MRISDDVIEKVLQQGGEIDESQLAQVKLLAEHSHTSLYNIVISERVVTPQDLAKLVSKQIGVPFVEIEPKDIPKEVLMKIPEHLARQYNVVLFAQDPDGTLSLAMEDPDDIQALNFIQKEIGYNLNVFLATHENILDCLENYRGELDQELDEVISVQQENTQEETQAVTEDQFAEDSPIAQTVNLLLEYAINSQASDIHIEP